MATVLYLSYDGVSDPLGQSQVLPYLRELSRLGYRIHLVSFEKPRRFRPRQAELRASVERDGIDWHPLRYTKHPLVFSTVWDVLRLQWFAARLHRTYRFDLVHCRSYVTALAGLRLKRAAGVRFIFDMRGFWPDEKVEGGTWNLGIPIFRWVYRYFKKKESQFVAEADAIVSLTNAGRRVIETWASYGTRRPPIAVIPCAAEFDVFTVGSREARTRARAELGIAPDEFVVAYLGSLGTWYLLGEMLDWFSVLRDRRERCRLLLVTPDSPAPLFAEAAKRGIKHADLSIVSATRERVPFYLSATDVGLFFIRPTPSKQASSPTKLGEYLAMGIPVVTNAGVGDVDDVVSALGAGIVIPSFSEAAYVKSIEQLEAITALDPQMLRSRAREVLDLSAGVEAYAGLYRALLA
jgi:glycosyltransferase involved in cell wall biosynthesis